MTKTYLAPEQTPRGSLQVAVRINEDWGFALRIEMISARSINGSGERF